MPRWSPAHARVEVENVSLRLPKYLAVAIRKYCEQHVRDDDVLGRAPPTVSAVIRQLIEERFGEEARKLEQQARKAEKG